MKIRQLSRLWAAMVLAMASLLTITAPTAHAAGTNTWTGSANDGQWSTAGNWTAGVPTTGDDLVFNNSSYGSGGVVDNIPNLTVNSITFNDNGGTPISIDLQGDLTVTSAITQSATATTASNAIASATGTHTLTLGGNVAVTANGGLTLGKSGDVIALAGNTLTFTSNTSVTSANAVNIRANITGNGSVVYNSARSTYTLYGSNTYSGTTHVIKSAAAVGNNAGNNAFGSSAITVEPTSSIIFRYSTTTTINNVINVTGSTSLATSVNFNNIGGSAITLKVPHIVLNGNTRLANQTVSKLTINVTGIDANGHCVNYLNNANSSTTAKASGFTGASADCSAKAAAGTNLGAPDTGFAGVAKTHPAIVFGVTTVAAALLVGAARRWQYSKR